MIVIQDQNGNTITSAISKALFADLASPESNMVYIRIKNNGITAVSNVGVFLLPASNLGTIEHFVNKTPDEFLQELLNIGSIDNQDYGLSINYNNEQTRFSNSNGNNKTNKIVLVEELAAGEFISVGLRFVRDPNQEAEIIYVGVEAE